MIILFNKNPAHYLRVDHSVAGFFIPYQHAGGSEWNRGMKLYAFAKTHQIDELRFKHFTEWKFYLKNKQILEAPWWLSWLRAPLIVISAQVMILRS